jgi:hypothetical protein
VIRPPASYVNRETLPAASVYVASRPGWPGTYVIATVAFAGSAMVDRNPSAPVASEVACPYGLEIVVGFPFPSCAIVVAFPAASVIVARRPEAS